MYRTRLFLIASMGREDFCRARPMFERNQEAGQPPAIASERKEPPPRTIAVGQTTLFSNLL
jgi:hypothetical protein